MSADIEGRLRAALHAYADAVEDSGDDVALPNRPPRGLIQHWRSPLLAAAAVVAVAGGVWTTVAVVDPGSTSTVAGGARAASAPDGGQRADTWGAPEDSAAESSAAENSAAEAAPATAGIGETVPFELYTHCGVLGTYLEGVWFAAEPPLVESAPLVPGGTNPPQGWGNPYQAGELTRLTADTAVFRDDLGHEVRLRLAPDEAPPPCA